MSRGSSGCFSIALVLVMLFCCGLAYVAGQRQWLQREPRAVPEALEVKPASDVVVAVQALARLETVAFHMERVVEVQDRQSRLFGLVQADDEILLVAVGDVTAGVDLVELGPNAIQIDPSLGRVTLRLPEPEVFSARLDNQRTRVHARRTDLLARRVEAIESRARQQAEVGIRQAALEAGILEHAERNAALTLSALVSSFGYSDVDIHFGPDPESHRE